MRPRACPRLSELEPRTAPAVITPFTPRFSLNTSGDIVAAANTLMTAPDTDPGAAAARAGQGTRLNNNDFNMVYVDVDLNRSTFNSSRATLFLPAGATVLFAGLYWGGDSDSPARTTALLDTPAPGGYARLAGTLIGTRTGGAGNNDYQSFADVTGLVRAAGAGVYTVANVQAQTGSDRQAGWALVVAYRDPAERPRNLTVFDGFAVVADNAADRNVTIPVSGFLTPPTGPVSARVGVVAYEGDRGSTGDTLRLNGVVLSDPLNPTNNFFNSTLARFGTAFTAKTPNFVNQLGFDTDFVRADGVIPNNATSATVTLNTGGETYFPGVVTTAIDLFAPQLAVDKFVVDLNGGAVLPGDVLEYTVTTAVVGVDDSATTVLRDPLPANVTYVPGTLAVVTGANAGAKTDAAGDDQAEVAGDTLVFRLGAGAGRFSGGLVRVGESTTVRFRVRVNAGLAGGTGIVNTATATAFGDTGRVRVTADGTASVGVAPSADLAVAKAVDNPSPVGSQAVTFAVTVTNLGPDAADGVAVRDLLPDGLVLLSAEPGRGTYDPATGLWLVGRLEAGASATLVLRARATRAGTFTNTASLAGSSLPDPNPANDASSASVTPVAPPPVVVAPPPPGGGIVVPLPPGVSVGGSDSSGGTFDPNTGVFAPAAPGATLTLVLVNPAGDTVVVTLTVGPLGTLVPAGTVTLIAPGTTPASKQGFLASTPAAASPAALTASASPLPGLGASGAGPGGPPLVRLYDPTTGRDRLAFYAYDRSFTGGVAVAVADFDGDGIVDVATAPGAGGGPHVKVFSGADGSLLRSFFAFDPSFTGGVTVAAGDVDGDGTPDLIVGAGAGGGPVVSVFRGADGSLLGSWMAFAPGFSGGVNVAAADLDGDGRAEVIAGAGPGGGPVVSVFAGAAGTLVSSFFAFPPAYAGGVGVAAGDTDGDGVPDLVAGAGPVVSTFDAGGRLKRSALAFDPGYAGPLAVAAGDADGDGSADVFAAAGPAVRVVRARDGAVLGAFFADVPGLPGTVSLAGADPTFLGGVPV